MANSSPLLGKNGMAVIHQKMFFDMYAGCLLKAYGPLVMMPRWVRFENRSPKEAVAQEKKNINNKRIPPHT